MIDHELPIKDYPDFVKDTNSNAILNSNYAALTERKKQKEMEKTVNCLSSDVSSLKSDMNEIKQLLTVLINK